jgi:hypothetical protein
MISICREHRPAATTGLLGPLVALGLEPVGARTEQAATSPSPDVLVLVPPQAGIASAATNTATPANREEDPLGGDVSAGEAGLEIGGFEAGAGPVEGADGVAATGLQPREHVADAASVDGTPVATDTTFG